MVVNHPQISLLITHFYFLDFVRSTLQDPSIDIRPNGTCDIQLGIESSAGQLMRDLPKIPPHPNRVLFSQNYCPEYYQDLMEFQPMVLVHGLSATRLNEAIAAAKAGQTWYSYPKSQPENTLTPKERQVLRLRALGFTHEEVAVHVKLSEKATRNMVSKIYDKIRANHPMHQLKNEIHFSRYYFGATPQLRAEYSDPEIPFTEEQLLQKDIKTFKLEHLPREEALKILQETNSHNKR